MCALVAAAFDIRQGRIPNRLTYSGMVAGLAVRGVLGGWRGLGDGLLAGLLGGGIFFLFFLVRGMGAGDVKLMTALGCWTGVRETLVILTVTAIAGGALAIGYLLFYRRGVRTLRNLAALLRFHFLFGLRPHPEISLNNPEAIRIPYAVAMAAGALYSLSILLMRG